MPSQKELGTTSRNKVERTDRNGGYRPKGSRRSLRGPLALLAGGLAVIILAIVLLPPFAGGLMRDMAEGNPDLIRLPFFSDAVSETIGDRPDQPAGTDPTPVDFEIPLGTGSSEITAQLFERGLVTDRLAFAWVLVKEGGSSNLQAGTHVLNRTMSPRQVATALQAPPVPVAQKTNVALRGGLRIEQVVAYLEDNRDDYAFDPADFYALASEPPADLVAAYSMLGTKPADRSLEGYLGLGVFQIDDETDAQGFLEILLERRQAELEPLLASAAPEGLADFYQVLTMASIVEAETNLATEKSIVAGVYLNRLDPDIWPTRLLNADPTVIYGNDTVILREQQLSQWPAYNFWAGVGGPMAEVSLPGDLAGFQTYRTRGLPPGPIRSPSVDSINGVLAPDSSELFLYFVSKGDGSHAFARTWEEHLANVAQYQGGATPTP